MYIYRMDLNIAHVREVFYRMGFNDREIVSDEHYILLKVVVIVSVADVY